MKYSTLLMIKGFPAHSIELEIEESKLKGLDPDEREYKKQKIALHAMADQVEVVVTEIKGKEC